MINQPHFCCACGISLAGRGYTVHNNRLETTICDKRECSHSLTGHRGVEKTGPKYNVVTGQPLTAEETKWIQTTAALWQAFLERSPYPPEG